MKPRSPRKLLPVLALAAICTALAPASASAAVPGAPPKPVVGVPGGPHRLAAPGSYCWSGSMGSLCADTIDPIEYAPTIHLAAGADPIVRMGYPVRRVGAFIGEERLDLTPLGQRGRKFRLPLPDRSTGDPLEVYLFATYDRGDGSFAIKIASRRR